MLFRSTRRRFASQRALEQERRLAWLAQVAEDNEDLLGATDKLLTGDDVESTAAAMRNKLLSFSVISAELAAQASTDRTILAQLRRTTDDARLQSLLDARIDELIDGVPAPASVVGRGVERELETLLDGKNPQALLAVLHMLTQRLHDYDVNAVVYDPSAPVPAGDVSVPKHGERLMMEDFLREEAAWLAKKGFHEAGKTSAPGDLADILPKLTEHELRELAGNVKIDESLPETQLRYIIANYASKARRQAERVRNDTGNDGANVVPPRTRLLQTQSVVDVQIANVLKEKAKATLDALEQRLNEARKQNGFALQELPPDMLGHAVVETMVPLLVAANVNEKDGLKRLTTLLQPLLGDRLDRALTAAKSSAKNERARQNNQDPMHRFGVLNGMLRNVEDLHRALGGNAQEFLDRMFGAETAALKQCADLAAFIAPNLPDSADKTFLLKFANGKANRADKNQLWNDFPLEVLKRLAAIHCSPQSGEQQERLRMYRTESNSLDVGDLPKVRAEFEAVRDAVPALAMPAALGGGKLMDHEVLQTLGGAAEWQKHCTHVESLLLQVGSIKLGANEEDTLRRLRTENVQKAATHVKLLQHAYQLLRGFSDGTSIETVSSEQFLAQNGQDGSGYFDIQRNVICLNGDKPEELRQTVLHHELGHALLHALGRNTGIVAGAFSAAKQTLQQSSARDSQGGELPGNMMDVLRGLETDYRIPTANKSQAEKDDLLLDELLNRYASWRRGGRPRDLSNSLRSREQPLFDVLDEKFPTKPAEPDLLTESFDTDRLQMTDAERLLQQQNDDQGTTLGGSSDLHKPEQAIGDVYHALSLAEAFVRDHPDTENIALVDTWLKSHKKDLIENIEQPFRKNLVGHNEAMTVKLAKELQNRMAEGMKAIKEFQKNELGLGDAKPVSKSGLVDIWNSINWVSINDIIEVGKSAWEDLQSQWKVRGQKAQAALGKTLTDFLPNDIPYLGQLKQEFTRRSNNAELEEVKRWKDGLTECDSYALLDLIPTTRNKYQLRAIIELLTEKGRMDWNNEEFWKVLNELGNFKMPIDACRNNDVLRDKWLMKMITDIWGDKEHFYGYRQTNDSAYNSGMEKFTAQVDQLSNVRGGMAGELERQLKGWDLINKKRRNGESPDVPNDINPHKYEKLLKYAIENGKMSMEDKLFYLVQGVASGLMSIDRLRALAGETGGVLNVFPLIDYFYGHNNSLPEVQALARRLRENNDPEKGTSPYEPGQKTTLWIHLEVLRDENVRQRVSKATSGGRLEKIDHEDIPTLINVLTYNDVERLLDVISGSRQQLSPEAQKNGYVGFSNKFKTLGLLAELDQAGEAKFTTQDAFELAKTIACAVHYDNILTQNAFNKDSRPKLTWEDINTTGGPSIAGGMVVKNIRDLNNQFISDMIEEMDLNWDEIVKSKVEPGKTPENPQSKKEKYLRKPGDEVERPREKQIENFDATKRFSLALAEKMKSNLPGVMKVLRKHASTLIHEGASSPDDLKTSHIREFFKAQEKSRKEAQTMESHFVLGA